MKINQIVNEWEAISPKTDLGKYAKQRNKNDRDANNKIHRMASEIQKQRKAREQSSNEENVDEAMGWATKGLSKILFAGAYKKALELLAKEVEDSNEKASIEYHAANMLKRYNGGELIDPRELASMFRKQQTAEGLNLDEGTTAEVYKTNGKYWVVDVESPKIKYTDWGPTGAGFDSKEEAEAFAKKVTKEGLEEAPGAIRKGLAAVAMIAALWGVNNQMAQQAYDASPQLQKLTAYLEVAKDHNDQRMIDQLESRIEAHKARLDLGKGDVMDKDGRPINVVYDKEKKRQVLNTDW